MQSYMHPNSATTPPTLRGETRELYQAIVKRRAIPPYDTAGHDLVGDLHLVAERIACDQAAEALRGVGLDATVIDRDSDLVSYHEAAVCIRSYSDLVSVDAEAALRIAQRVRAGLTPDEAIRRTLEQCSQPTLSAHALRELEREVDAHVRRLDDNPAAWGKMTR